jgi:hypothetical protein
MQHFDHRYFRRGTEAKCKVQARDAGADDCSTGFFGIGQLLVHISTVLAANQCTRAGKPRNLSLELLILLRENPR